MFKYGAMQNNDVKLGCNAKECCTVMVLCKIMMFNFGSIQNNTARLWCNAKE